MAKVVKDTRKTIDVDSELTKIKEETKKEKNTKEKKHLAKKEKSNATKTKKDKKKNKKRKLKFLHEVKSEISKVKWPSKKDMIKYSLATIMFIIFFAVFFYLIDLAIALLKEVI